MGLPGKPNAIDGSEVHHSISLRDRGSGLHLLDGKEMTPNGGTPSGVNLGWTQGLGDGASSFGGSR
jgi:hypothetical protein